MREKILETYREKAYRVKPSTEGIQKRREWAKMKRRRRAAARRKK
jgi:hypothetical protein